VEFVELTVAADAFLVVVAVVWQLVFGLSSHSPLFEFAVAVEVCPYLQMETAEMQALVPTPSWHPHHPCSSNRHHRHCRS